MNYRHPEVTPSVHPGAAESAATVRAPAAARVVAAAVAVMLSGAPRVAALHAPVEGHRCTCRVGSGGEHRCTCVQCWRLAQAARSSDAKLRPCCRADARKQLAAEHRGAGARCDGVCGDGARPPMNVAGAEPFLLLGRLTPGLPLTRALFAPRAEPGPERSLEPETPPPRSV